MITSARTRKRRLPSLGRVVTTEATAEAWQRPGSTAGAGSVVVWLFVLAIGSSAQPLATWTPVEPTGPAGRSGHAMTYDAARQRTLLFGGEDMNGALLADTWVWDGSAWVRLDVSGPPARAEATLVYDGARHVAVLFGGRGAEGAKLGDTWEWDGTGWQLLEPSPAPAARSDASMAWDAARGVCVLFGGLLSGQQASHETWTWDGSTWTLAATTGPSGSGSTAAAYDTARGVVVLFGGGGWSAWEWNGVEWSQRPAAELNPHLWLTTPHGSLVFDTARHVSVLFPAAGSSSGVWEYDGDEWTARDVTFHPPDRHGAAMAYDAARSVCVLFGGGLTNETWEWDGSVWTLRFASGPSARSNAAFCFDTDRNVAVLFSGDASSARSMGDTWEWDGTQWQLRAVLPFATPYVRLGGQPVFLSNPMLLRSHALTYDATRHAAIMLGERSPYSPYPGPGQESVAQLWRWDGVTWQVGDAGTAVRSGYAITYDEARQVVVRFGGSDGDGRLTNDTQEWDGAQWKLHETSSAAPPDDGGKLAYDVRRRVSVLYSVSGETWEWNGRKWRSFAATGPGPRTGCALAYDRARRRVVLFGGATTGVTPLECHNDLWQWVDGEWEQILAGDVLPVARSTHAMTYDAARDEFIVFGGCTGTDGQYLDDTWRLKITGGAAEGDSAPERALDCGPLACGTGVGLGSLTCVGLMTLKWRCAASARRHRVR